MSILNSWKEIANYLGRGVRTVQRWERDLGLPVHRPKGKNRSAVLAFPEELDQWLHGTPVRPFATLADPPPDGRKTAARDSNLLIKGVRVTSARSHKLAESLMKETGRHRAVAASLYQTLRKFTRRGARDAAAHP